MRELEQQRASLWQQAAHDLRGNLSAVANATAALTSPQGSEEFVRRTFLRLLGRNVDALQHLLSDVTTLARLQGGLEERAAVRMDAAGLLRDLCDGMQADAHQRGLYLRADGPGALWVEGDPVKIRRITQNLVLNAIRYTRHGGVVVTWRDSGMDDTDRWCIEVQDTGPGLQASDGSRLLGALELATDQAKHVADAKNGDVEHAQPLVEAASQSRRHASKERGHGEGLGLTIVKRLSELLNATVEVESSSDAGTTFRILLPRGYST